LDVVVSVVAVDVVVVVVVVDVHYWSVLSLKTFEVSRVLI